MAPFFKNTFFFHFGANDAKSQPIFLNQKFECDFECHKGSGIRIGDQKFKYFALPLGLFSSGVGQVNSPRSTSPPPMPPFPLSAIKAEMRTAHSGLFAEVTTGLLGILLPMPPCKSGRKSILVVAKHFFEKNCSSHRGSLYWDGGSFFFY